MLNRVNKYAALITRWLTPLLMLLAAHATAQLQSPLMPQATTDEADAPASGEPGLPTRTSIELKIEEIAPQIQSAQEAANDETVQRIGIPIEELTQRADRLRSLDGMLQQQIGVLQRLDEVESAQSDLNALVAEFEEKGIEEPPPYSVSFADRLHDEAHAAERDVELHKAALDSAEVELSDAADRVDDAERERRAALEASERNTDTAQAAERTWKLNRAELEVDYRKAVAGLKRLRVELAGAELDLARAQHDLAQKKLDSVVDQTIFTRKELDERLDDLASRRQAVENELPTLREDHEAAEAQRRDARDRLDAAQDETVVAARSAQLAMRTAALDAAARKIELAEKKLSLFDDEKRLRERRFAVWQGEDDATITEWREDTELALEEINRDRQLQESRLLDLRSTVLDIEKQLSDWNPADGDQSIVQARLDALRDREASLNDYLAALLPVERLTSRLLNDINRVNEHISLSVRWERVQNVLGSVWNFEVFAFEDDSITVRKVVIALLILIFGIIIAGLLTRSLRKRLLSRTPLNENAAAAIEKIIYYAAIVLILLYALNFVNIPLTLFAFFGGAIAIAVGFGAQHLINNFISGFILMLERPIRIGDLVELNGTYGHIRQIGARSTQLHLAENIDLLIPNSQLLENVVTNWTRSDERLRTSVSVGVMYGSPTELVTKLLMQATTEVKRVLDSPKPIILFTEFGDNALTFEVHFWVRMRRIMDKRLVESEIRYNIDRLFRENDIVIAFPQRDLHIDSLSPVEIRVLSDKDSPKED